MSSDLNPSTSLGLFLPFYSAFWNRHNCSFTPNVNGTTPIQGIINTPCFYRYSFGAWRRMNQSRSALSAKIAVALFSGICAPGEASNEALIKEGFGNIESWKLGGSSECRRALLAAFLHKSS